ncbi:ABC transporter permease [Candidatus Bathyarchaeota archaeon]|nr:ABC transporter permease [Candidatus Bathyarchaeota archaeon]
MAIYVLLIFSLQFKEVNLGLAGSGAWDEMWTKKLVCFGLIRMITDPFFYIYRFVSPLLVLLTSVVFSYEHETGILRSLMLKPVKKTTVFLAKLAYLIITAMLIFIVSSTIYLVQLEPKAFNDILSVPEMLPSMIIVNLHYFTMFLTIISLSTFLSIIIKRTSISAGISIAILYMLEYIETVATSLRTTLPPWSIDSTLIVNVSNIFWSQPLVFGAVLNVILASFILLALSWLVFGRMTEYE